MMPRLFTADVAVDGFTASLGTPASMMPRLFTADVFLHLASIEQSALLQ